MFTLIKHLGRLKATGAAIDFCSESYQGICDDRCEEKDEVRITKYKSQRYRAKEYGET
jgi:hypothetical protein